MGDFCSLQVLPAAVLCPKRPDFQANSNTEASVSLGRGAVRYRRKDAPVHGLDLPEAILLTVHRAFFARGGVNGYDAHHGLLKSQRKLPKLPLSPDEYRAMSS